MKWYQFTVNFIGVWPPIVYSKLVESVQGEVMSICTEGVWDDDYTTFWSPYRILNVEVEELDK